MKNLYKLVNYQQRDSTYNIKVFNTLDNIQNFEKCAKIINNPQFKMKRCITVPSGFHKRILRVSCVSSIP